MFSESKKGMLSMNYLEIILPEHCGETTRFACSELNDFLSRCGLKEKISLTMKISPEYEQEEFALTGNKAGGFFLSAGSETALLYGSYEFLKQLGFRFFSPDPWDTVIPECVSEIPELDILA